MKREKEDVIDLIHKIWDKIHPMDDEFKFDDPLIYKLYNDLTIKRYNIVTGKQDYNLGYLYSLLMCIIYSLSEKSSTHSKLESYIDELDKIDKRTFVEWIEKLTLS